MKRAETWLAGRTRAGLAALALCAASTTASALSYRLIDADLPNCKGPCPKVIVVSGTIGQNEYLQFISFLKDANASHRLSSTVLIESPGGFRGDGAILGILLRKLKMKVIVARPTGNVVTANSGLAPATCASACVLVLAGGTSRFFVPGSRVGVHRSHTGRAVLDPATRKNVSGTVDHAANVEQHVQFFRTMGVDPQLSKVIDDTPSETIRWLTPEEMKRYRLAQPSGGAR
ncbi:MAG: hypothetical protein LCH38_10025 [Proteobacteria bacterium]|nr:hypothetical protein [Pseudomonadota bacterium]